MDDRISTTRTHQEVSQGTSHKTLAWIGLVLSALGGVAYFAIIGGLNVHTAVMPYVIASGVGLLLSTAALLMRPGKLTVATAIPSYLIGLGFILSIFVLMKLPEAQAGLAVGKMPPAFTLPNQDDKPVSLTDYRDKGPVLLVFYRGHW